MSLLSLGVSFFCLKYATFYDPRNGKGFQQNKFVHHCHIRGEWKKVAHNHKRHDNNHRPSADAVNGVVPLLISLCKLRENHNGKRHKQHCRGQVVNGTGYFSWKCKQAKITSRDRIAWASHNQQSRYSGNHGQHTISQVISFVGKQEECAQAECSDHTHIGVAPICSRNGFIPLWGIDSCQFSE